MPSDDRDSMINIVFDALPFVPDDALPRQGEELFREAAREAGGAIEGFARDALTEPSVSPLLRGVFTYSPYLTQELAKDLPFAREVVEDGPDDVFQRMVDE